MKLASLKGGRDGRLAVVSHDLTRAVLARDIAPTLQAALDDWDETAPRLMRHSMTLLNAGRRRGRLFLRCRGLRQPPAARLSMGGRLGLCHPCRTGAQGARRRDAAKLLDRSADVSGRLGQFSRPDRSDHRRRRKLGHRLRRRSRGDHRRRADGALRSDAAAAHQAGDAGQRCQPAQSDPGASWPRASASSSPSPPAPFRPWR